MSGEPMAKAVSFGRFRPDSSGISSYFKSGPMQSLLGGIVEPIGAACNAEAVENIGRDLHIGPEDIDVEPYQAGVKVGRSTALGYVNVRGLGELNETIHHTLTRRNH